jgi:hypothetical protein
MTIRVVTPPSPGIRSIILHLAGAILIYDKLARSLAAGRVVGRLLGNDDVVWVALA